MDLLEYQGQELFRRHGIPVPAGFLMGSGLPDTEKVVVKAQVPVGKRADAGGIKVVDRELVDPTVEHMMQRTVAGEPVRDVLIQAYTEMDAELYMSMSVNRAGKNYHLVFTEEGGTGVEEIAEESPGAVHTMDLHTFDREAIAEEFSSRGFEYAEEATDIAERLHALMREEDGLLAEINPLGVTDEGLMAVDSKVRLDDTAAFRHDGWPCQPDTDDGLQFVELDGNIGVIGNGAGLVMATLDTIDAFDGSPADFLDLGGGSDIETVRAAMSKAMEMDHVDGLFVNIFGGITRCDEVAQGIIGFVEEQDLDLPLVVRMVGTNQDEGRQMLEDAGIHALDSMDACAEKIVELAEEVAMAEQDEAEGEA